MRPVVFPAVADVPSETPSQDPPQPIAAEPAIPQPATEKKYRLPAGQKVPPAQLHQRADQRAAMRNKPEGNGPEEQGAKPAAAVPPPVHRVPTEGAPQPPLPHEAKKEKFCRKES